MVLRLGIFQQMAKYKWPTVGDALIGCVEIRPSCPKHMEANFQN